MKEPKKHINEYIEISRYPEGVTPLHIIAKIMARFPSYYQEYSKDILENSKLSDVKRRDNCTFGSMLEFLVQWKKPKALYEYEMKLYKDFLKTKEENETQEMIEKLKNEGYKILPE